MSPANEPPGFYGKLPARGDFIMRRLGRPFLDAWDDWLQRAIVASRTALGDQWLDIYLTSPIWRFALGAGTCGPNTILGVLMPSVDKVGRYFPLMLGREFEPGIELSGLMSGAFAWYQAIEDLALAALAPEFPLETLDHPIAFDAEIPPASSATPGPLALPGLHVPFDENFDAAEFWRAHGPASKKRTLWWTSGSQSVSPCLLICPGLPAAASFAALLDGGWQRDGWLGAPERAALIPEFAAETIVADAAFGPSVAEAAAEPSACDATPEPGTADAAVDPGPVDVLAELMGSDVSNEPEAGDRAAEPPMVEGAAESSTVDVMAELIGSDATIEPEAADRAAAVPVVKGAAEPSTVDVLAELTGSDAAIEPKAGGEADQSS